MKFILNLCPRYRKAKKTAGECRRCGTCCEKGGPALHGEDRPLVDRGQVPARCLFTIRAGEPVRDDMRMFSYNIMRYSARKIVARYGYRSLRNAFVKRLQERVGAELVDDVEIEVHGQAAEVDLHVGVVRSRELVGELGAAERTSPFPC